MSKETDYRIIGPGWVATVSIGLANRVSFCTKRLQFMAGWDYQSVEDHCRRAGWQMEKAGDPFVP